MRISSLHIENYCAAKLISISGLGDSIVIAGPNGSGKSCIFDAIRLLKASYDQTTPNILSQILSEKDVHHANIEKDAYKILNDPEKDLVIRAEIEFTNREIGYVVKRSPELYERFAWRFRSWGDAIADDVPIIDPNTRRTQNSKIVEISDAQVKLLRDSIGKTPYIAELRMSPSGKIETAPSPLIDLAFSIHGNKILGTIDYHGPNRSYGREPVSGIDINNPTYDGRRRQSSIYNYQDKYSNIKNEMAQIYIRKLIEEDYSGEKSSNALFDTLKELFKVFFPGKEFLGIKPLANGRLSFPVKLENGREHDINELSSGEKEVLLGYLRLRNSAPSSSIILLDEPELHLNPRLIRGLPRFYQKYIGEALGNQIWLITHSDALLREAFEEPKYTLFQLEPNHTAGDGNQAHKVELRSEVDRAIYSLAGDFASWNPHSRIVLVEGGGGSETDVNLLRKVFPDFAERVNLISGGTKNRVRETHEILNKLSKEGKLNASFYSIVDQDFDAENARPSTERRYQWDVYHIENYLLDERYLKEVISSYKIENSSLSESDVGDILQKCAEETVNELIRIKMDKYVNSKLTGSIKIRFDRKTPLSQGFADVSKISADRINEEVRLHLNQEALLIVENGFKDELRGAIVDGSWKAKFRGRDVLERFAGKIGLGIPYPHIRNQVINRMRDDNFQPAGMRRILDLILEESDRPLV